MAKLEFTSEFNGNKVDLVTIEITKSIRDDANKIYAEAFSEAVANKMLLADEVNKILRDKNLVDDENDDKLRDESLRKLKDLEIKLRSRKIGSARMTPEEGKTIALEMRKERSKLRTIGRTRSDLMNKTAEGYAENEQMQYFVYRCTVRRETGTTFWGSLAEFKESSGLPVYNDALNSFVALLTGSDKDYEKSLYENKWLIRMKFMTDDLQLIDSAGRLVDEEGRLINKEGRYINDKNEFIDKFGNAINEKGELVVKDEWDEEVKVSGETFLEVFKEVASNS